MIIKTARDRHPRRGRAEVFVHDREQVGAVGLAQMRGVDTALQRLGFRRPPLGEPAKVSFEVGHHYCTGENTNRVAGLWFLVM